MKIKRVFGYLLLIGFLAFTSLAVYCFNFIKNFNDITKLLEYKPTESTKVFDRHGMFVTKIGEKKQYFTPLDKIPKTLIRAFISAEDKTFYSNSGFDFQGNIRAMFVNFKNTFTGQRYSGASTITQQVVRNVLLTSERTLSRKIKEITLSLYITNKISKDKIMETYLNHIFLGNNAYGVAGAANVYFDKTLDQLTLDEIAILASLPKSPSLINPFKNPTRTLSRRNWILLRMKEDGVITPEEYQDAKSTQIVVATNKKTYGHDYVEHVKNILTRENNIQDDDFGAKGYSVYLDMDLQLQKISQEKLDQGLRDFDKRHGYRGHVSYVDFANKNEGLNHLKKIHQTEKSEYFISAIITEVEDSRVILITKDSQEGEIKLGNVKWARKYISHGHVGNEIKKMQDLFKKGDIIWVKKISDGLFSLEQIPEIEGGIIIVKTDTGEVLSMVGGYGNSQAGRFNRVIQAKRQLGSIVKPFIYLSALQNGLKPTDTFLDYDKEYDLGNGIIWTPQNHTKSNLGKITLRKALEKSVNTVTIRLAEEIGLSKVMAMIKILNISNEFEPNLGIALGNFESTLHDILRAYGVLANSGKNYEFRFYSKFSDKHDYFQNSLLQSEDRIVDEISAYQVINMLEGAVLRGTAYNSKRLDGYPLAAKTGTSNDGVDLWYVGINSGVMVGIFAGFDSPVPTYEYGATVALPIFNSLVEDIEPYMSKRNFKSPVEGVKYVKINRDTGLRTAKNEKSIYEIFKASDVLPKFEDEVEKERTQEDIYETY